MAHLLEPLCCLAVEEILQYQTNDRQQGGIANGTTYYDRTKFHEILPASDSNSELGLGYGIDRW